DVTPGNVELASPVGPDLANPRAAVGNQAAVAAGQTAQLVGFTLHQCGRSRPRRFIQQLSQSKHGAMNQIDMRWRTPRNYTHQPTWAWRFGGLSAGDERRAFEAGSAAKEKKHLASRKPANKSKVRGRVGPG